MRISDWSSDVCSSDLRKRLGMAQAVPEGFGGLARQRAARQVGDGARDHQRQLVADLVEQLVDAEHRGLGVQGVENGTEKKQVGAALYPADRKSVAWGRCGSVRVDPGGGGNSTKNT